MLLWAPASASLCKRIALNCCVGFAPVRTLREAFDAPHTAARQMHVVDELGQEHIGLPIKFSAEPGRADLRVPQLGEHTVETLRALGYSAADIEKLTVT